MKVVGIDLTSDERNASGLAIYDGDAYDCRLVKADADIIELCDNADLVAIDSPLSLPSGFCCLEESCDCHLGKPNGRTCERELVKMGIPLYFTTKKSIIKKMIYRAMRLSDAIGRHRVIEIYPYSIKVVLFGKPVPNKQTKAGLSSLKELIAKTCNITLGELIPLNHDACDAILASYTAYLHLYGKTLSIGAIEESPIVIPVLAPQGEKDVQ